MNGSFATNVLKIQTGASDLCLFAQYREVMPDAECAAKVARTLRRRFGEQAWEAISYALASEEADKSQAVYETIAAGLSGRIRGTAFCRHLQSHVSIGCLH